MQQLVVKYLAQKGTVTIQNMGTFSLEHLTPTLQPIHKTITAPQQHIHYSSSASDTCSGFIAYVSQQLHISIADAVDYINNHVSHIKACCVKNGYDAWFALGTFKQKGNGELAFTAIENLSYLQPTQAVKVVRTSDTHTITVGENQKTNAEMKAFFVPNTTKSNNTWLLISLIAALISIGYILYYYLKQ